MDTAARRLWTVLEPIHAVVYFAPEARDAFAGLGLKGFWMGYFASRAAPLGPVGPEVVTAAFYGFARRMVERALPDAWSYAAPIDVLVARNAVADAALARLLGDDADLAEAAELATALARAAKLEGRTLFASYAALPWPESPRLRLWHAATLVREHRGDGHVAALMTAGVDGCAAHVIAETPRQVLQPNRGWTDSEWAAAAAAVQGREHALRAEVEATTDRLASQPLDVLGPDAVNRLVEVATPLARRIVAAGGVPMPNPMGAPAP
jgi:helix-turn-helix protein